MDGLTVVAVDLTMMVLLRTYTYGIKYVYGKFNSCTKLKVNYDATGTNDQEATHYGISMAVNDNLIYQLVDKLLKILTLLQMMKLTL